MSFRLFIYYCAAWGGATALFGWLVGKFLEGDNALLGTALQGMALGIFVAVGIGFVDSLASSSRRDVVSLGIRLSLAMLIGAVGGLLGGFLGQLFYDWSDGSWPSLRIFGWTLTGLLVGAAPSMFDYLGAVMRNEERQGAKRKLRNGILGGAIGGMMGGFVSMMMHGVWAKIFVDAESQDLWSPSAAGFVALGACIGLAIALAQIILREAWLRVEAGFRPGRQILLTKPETTIGRAESCDVGLFGDPTIEKEHATIRREGNIWTLVDNNTPSGTMLNGQRLNGSAPLNPGDQIQVGSSILSFGVRAQQAAPAPTAVAVLS